MRCDDHDNNDNDETNDNFHEDRGGCESVDDTHMRRVRMAVARA